MAWLRSLKVGRPPRSPLGVIMYGCRTRSTIFSSAQNTIGQRARGPQRVPRLGEEKLRSLAGSIAPQQARGVTEEHLHHRQCPGELLPQVGPEGLGAGAEREDLRHEYAAVAASGEHHRVQVVLCPRWLEATDLEHRGGAVAAMRADDEGGLAVAVEAAL